MPGFNEGSDMIRVAGAALLLLVSLGNGDDQARSPPQRPGVTVHQQFIIRVSPLPRSGNRVGNVRQNVVWQEERGPRCIPIRQVLGAASPLRLHWQALRVMINLFHSYHMLVRVSLMTDEQIRRAVVFEGGEEMEAALARFTQGLPNRFETASGDPRLHAVLVDADAATGRATHIQRVAVDANALEALAAESAALA